MNRNDLLITFAVLHTLKSLNCEVEKFIPKDRLDKLFEKIESEVPEIKDDEFLKKTLLTILTEKIIKPK